MAPTDIDADQPAPVSLVDPAPDTTATATNPRRRWNADSPRTGRRSGRPAWLNRGPWPSGSASAHPSRAARARPPLPGGYDARVTASIRRGADPDGVVQLDGDADGDDLPETDLADNPQRQPREQEGLTAFPLSLSMTVPWPSRLPRSPLIMPTSSARTPRQRWPPHPRSA